MLDESSPSLMYLGSPRSQLIYNLYEAKFSWILAICRDSDFVWPTPPMLMLPGATVCPVWQ